MFYERIGGTWIGNTDLEIGGKKLKEDIYVWNHLSDFKL